MTEKKVDKLLNDKWNYKTVLREKSMLQIVDGWGFKALEILSVSDWKTFRKVEKLFRIWKKNSKKI